MSGKGTPPSPETAWVSLHPLILAPPRSFKESRPAACAASCPQPHLQSLAAYYTYKSPEARSFQRAILCPPLFWTALHSSTLLDAFTDGVNPPGLKLPQSLRLSHTLTFKMLAVRSLAQQPLRQYSRQAAPSELSGKVKGYAVTGYLCTAFVAPFVPPYLASKRTQQDGTWLTR